MPMKTCIKNGIAVFADRLEQTDLLLDGERIAAFGSSDAADILIDARGCFIFPGFIDLHTHLDDVIAGRPLADTWRSGSHIALQNGITTLGSFITQRRDESLQAAIDCAQAKAGGNAHGDYLWHLTPLRFDESGWREIEEAVERGFTTFKFYTTYREAGLYSGYEELEGRIKRLHALGCRVLVHCEDEALLLRAQSAKVDWRDPHTHARVRPAAAEIAAIRRLIDIGRKSGARLHIVHVSTPEGVEAIRAAHDVRITCETCPHYLFLDESYLTRPDGQRWLCAPPLRSSLQRQRLCELVRQGAVDLLASDHCAFSKTDKDAPGDDIRRVPGGVAGLGALPHLALRLFAGENKETAMPMLARLLSQSPARVAGIHPRKGTLQPGADADLVVLKSDGPERPIVSTLADAWETYPALTSRLEIRHVFLRGRRVAGNGKLLDEQQAMGACLCKV